MPHADFSTSKKVNEFLEQLRAIGDMLKYHAVSRKFLTCLQPAKYKCINESSPSDLVHYGLNFPLYTHFTSPIRRYADLLVHRLLTLTLKHKEKTRSMIDDIDYTDYAELCTDKTLNAKKASSLCTRVIISFF